MMTVVMMIDVMITMVDDDANDNMR